MRRLIFILIGLFVLIRLNLFILHAVIGLIVIIWLVGEIIGGIVAYKKKDAKMRNIHIWLGRIVFFIALLVVTFGILTLI